MRYNIFVFGKVSIELVDMFGQPQIKDKVRSEAVLPSARPRPRPIPRMRSSRLLDRFQGQGNF